MRNLNNQIFSELLAMSKINSLFVLASAVVMLSGTAVAQDCGSCGRASCGGGYSSAFGYPGSTSVGHGGHGSHREHLQSMRAEHHKIAARNDAWPKPFDCADRQLYHSMFTSMIDGGFEEQCVLCASHFDSESNELNAFGKHAVAGIMQNMPSHRKQVFVTRDSNERVSAERLANVDSVIKTYYGQVAPNASVTYSTKQPASVTGIRADMISQKFVEGQPSPNIPIAAGGGSVSASVGQ
jgi:hypothetical protein